MLDFHSAGTVWVSNSGTSCEVMVTRVVCSNFWCLIVCSSYGFLCKCQQVVEDVFMHCMPRTVL